MILDGPNEQSGIIYSDNRLFSDNLSKMFGKDIKELCYLGNKPSFLPSILSIVRLGSNDGKVAFRNLPFNTV
ncbi:hypothetical protein SAMN05443550_104294 [Pedobacter hartonius]|uniref:Uncharacterized protein n=1 Tax=Pedobacter hartonius TaxID=425514 RepID=A0A1H4D1T4_9SPHI|nr:hypothetical protein SAMN05443550_104294 [Pedobacter hartonius]